MNPIDHPHGGGEGKTKGGRHPVTHGAYQLKATRLVKTKRTARFIVVQKAKITN